MSTQKNKAIFFDRDGVVILSRVVGGKPFPILSYSDIHIRQGMYELMALASRQYKIIVVTNQPDVARGTQTVETVEGINKFLLESLPIDEIYTCYHDNDDNCNCRKPKIGFGLMAGEKYNLDFKKSWMIGDRCSDIEFGKALGCRTIFVKNGYKEKVNCVANFYVPSTHIIMGIILGE